MTDRELMQQALEALDLWVPLACADTIAALRERLARQEQEPVPWQTEETYDKDGVLIGRRMKRGPDCEWEPWFTPTSRERLAQPECQYAKDVAMPEYRCIGKCQYAQHEAVEPKCGAIIEVFGKDWRLDYMSLPVGKHKLYTQQYTYTAPQRREWVGLTEQEQEVLWDEAVDRQEHFCSQYGDFADAIEAKLKEKNA